MGNLIRKRYAATHAHRGGWPTLVALAAFGLVGCSGDALGGFVEPGSILVRTATTGFLKAEGYGLVVDGVNTMAIGANDEVTVPGLDPGAYLVELADVPDNCTVEGVLVPVQSAETAEAALTIECVHDDPISYTIQFSRERPDLETEAITVCSFGFCPTEEAWDLWVYNSSGSEPRSVIRQNQATGVEIAHLPGVTLAELAEADYQAATFTTELMADPFDPGRVILIRTDLGNVYALGNPSEDVVALTLTFDAALIAQP